MELVFRDALKGEGVGVTGGGRIQQTRAGLRARKGEGDDRRVRTRRVRVRTRRVRVRVRRE